ncbi:uncharacterized protein LOC110933700 [Helianthus annuus]|uniref:uncharacterized protein LOC110933700 n=1 Tax=Helianthus annuus TaxID=4232 RepID=UPI000B8FC963|nr:uncharacterized protein LOC110933700 [Helianthus annuus]
MAKKGSSVKVDKRCLVQFSIGTRYKDEAWCEVVPMDACHLLLGRPWQFDRKTTHDGFKNTYSFTKDGVNVTLVPSDERVQVKAKTSLLLQASAFERSFLEERLVFAVIVLEANQSGSSVPQVIQPLLHEFKDIFPDDIPIGLPPMRDIQHCIDLVPGSVIPNKPAYRMNPTEYEELHRQVTELLHKGLVQESKSLCAVPALLVPKSNGTFPLIK